MPRKDRGKANSVIRTLDLRDIDPSPHQRRKIFNVDKLKELTSSMQREGQIAAILVRRFGKRYELIAGVRRVRAIRDHTNMMTIEARIVVADDVEARRLTSAENALREDRTVFEAIEDIVDMVDSELIADEEYAWGYALRASVFALWATPRQVSLRPSGYAATGRPHKSMGDNPVDRVKTLLAKLYGVRRNEQGGYEVASTAKMTSGKFAGSVKTIFKKLPKPLEWQSFYRHDLNFIVDICMEVQKASVEHDLTPLRRIVSRAVGVRYCLK